MAQRIQGTEDLYGRYMRAWEYMCDTARNLFGSYGFDRIETPALEQVATFVHGIGESTDVVRKEMFRVFSGALLDRLLASGDEKSLKPKQRMAMRPEGTAGVVRAAVEHSFVPQGAAPVKLWYAEAMFRGERPQKGRLRQFHQVGVEWLGTEDPAADAECIIMLMEYFKCLGFDPSTLRLHINSMGDEKCRPAYRESVRQFIFDHKDEMCDDCLERANINPLRSFDCKNEHCQQVMKSAPLITDYLCDDCKQHYAQVKSYLDAAGIEYVEDPTLVRGLDYYTRTVFEIEVKDSEVGAIGGGGRYDGLMQLEGGKQTPGIGFAVGFERIYLALKAQGKALETPAPSCVYVAATSQDERCAAFDVTLALRQAGIRTEADYQGRSLKSQFKQADKLNARLCVVLGPDEVSAHRATIRDMQSHEQVQVPFDDLAQEVKKRLA